MRLPHFVNEFHTIARGRPSWRAALKLLLVRAMGFHPPPVVEVVGIVGMSASVVGVGMVRHREGRIALAFGLALVFCSALLGGFRDDRVIDFALLCAFGLIVLIGLLTFW